MQSRPITSIAVIQVIVVVIGFFAIRFFTIPLARPEFYHGFTPNYSKSAVFLHHWGGFLLAVPALWTIAACCAKRIDKGWLSESPALVLGGALAIVLAFWFLFTAFNAVHAR